MRNSGWLAAALLLGSSSPARAQEKTQDLGGAQALKILYAGDLNSPREKAFLDLLRGWFVRVDSLALANLGPKTAEPYDVVVADWKRLYRDGKFQSENAAPGHLEESFSKPIVMIGAVAGMIQQHSKIRWL